MLSIIEYYEFIISQQNNILKQVNAIKVYFHLPVSLVDEHKLVFPISLQASESFIEFH